MDFVVFNVKREEEALSDVLIKVVNTTHLEGQRFIQSTGQNLMELHDPRNAFWPDKKDGVLQLILEWRRQQEIMVEDMALVIQQEAIVAILRAEWQGVFQ